MGGLGNVAFSLHDGSQAGLAGARFAFGALAGGAFLLLQRNRNPRAKPPNRQAVLWLIAACGCEATAIALLMAAADHASTAVFTVIALCGPALTALLGRPLALPRASLTASALSVGALSAAGAAAWAAQSTPASVTWWGLGLALASTMFASASAVTASIAVHTYHPAVLVTVTCGIGLLFTAAWAATGTPITVNPSTIAAAAFIALIPGGIAKAVWLWANGQTAPQLVQAMAAIAVVTALAGGWVLLGETPTATQVILSLTAAILVGALATLRAPTRAKRTHTSETSHPQT